MRNAEQIRLIAVGLCVWVLPSLFTVSASHAQAQFCGTWQGTGQNSVGRIGYPRALAGALSAAGTDAADQCSVKSMPACRDVEVRLKKIISSQINMQTWGASAVAVADFDCYRRQPGVKAVSPWGTALACDQPFYVWSTATKPTNPGHDAFLAQQAADDMCALLPLCSTTRKLAGPPAPFQFACITGGPASSRLVPLPPPVGPPPVYPHTPSEPR